MNISKNTNILNHYDEILQMSIDELAEFLCNYMECNSDSCPGYSNCVWGEGAANGLKKWLKEKGGSCGDWRGDKDS